MPTYPEPNWNGQNIPIHHKQQIDPDFWMIPLMECFLEYDADTITDLLPKANSYGWGDALSNEWAWVMNSDRYVYFIPDFERFGCIPFWFPKEDHEGRKLSPQGQVDRFLYLLDMAYGGLLDDHRDVPPRALATAILELHDNWDEYVSYEEDGIVWELEMTMDDRSNLEEYAYPELYDLENPDFEPEGLFYLSLARELGGPVLELGCGTGRMTIPLAQNGLEITGLDAVPAMLALAREKAGSLPIEWIEADVRDFHLGRKFNFIFESGAVFMHMLSNADQDAFLERVREHLKPEGRFVVSVLFPHPDSFEPVTEEKEWFTYLDGQGRSVRVGGTEHYDPLRQVKTETALRRIASDDENEILHVAPLCLRYTFPQEMERLLEHAGFEVVERYGGPDRSPLSDDSQFLVYVCAIKDGQ